MILFLTRNPGLVGARSGGHSLTRTPCPGDRRRTARRGRAGSRSSRPPASTATVSAVRGQRTAVSARVDAVCAAGHDHGSRARPACGRHLDGDVVAVAVAAREPTMDTERTQASRRSPVPRSHSSTGRASPRSSSCVGHSASPGQTSRSPLCCQAASLATAGTWPSRVPPLAARRWPAPGSSGASASATLPSLRGAGNHREDLGSRDPVSQCRAQHRVARVGQEAQRHPGPPLLAVGRDHCADSQPQAECEPTSASPGRSRARQVGQRPRQPDDPVALRGR